ncbi:MAG: ribonuclease HII [Candidatus Gastranaerophilaceae bacterium]
MNSNHNLFEFDKNQECAFLLGTDEAGRGPAAGGVFAASVHINNYDIEKELSKLNDSKKLSKKVREELFDIILNNTVNSIICVEVDEIEKYNILNCSLKAMKLACENVIAQSSTPDSILTIVDGNQLIRNYNYPQKWVKKGDATSASIAAASILAKVSRDRYMQKLHEEFPEYNWAKNAGYLTEEHINSIKNFGICKYHRKSFLKKILAPEKQLSLL